MRQTNISRVLGYLETHKGLTSMEAFQLFGVTRLAAIIFDLRQRGYKIISQSRSAPNRYGSATVFVEYQLVKKENT